jgi:ABC-type multidrug transport system fused ATPase/permease subunit
MAAPFTTELNEKTDLALPARFREVWSEARSILSARRKVLFGGFVLMLVNRISGFVIPVAAKFLIDDVLGKHHTYLLKPIMGVMILGAIVQAATSFGFTQLLFRSSQRMVNDLRCKVQAHVGRLPVQFYDSTKIGVMISRIMTDAESVRSLLGNGMLDFIGGLLTGFVAVFILFRISPLLTTITIAFFVLFGTAIAIAINAIRPMVRERAKIGAEVTGRLAETLAGIRVIKAYRAEGREAEVFFDGNLRLMSNVMKTVMASSSIAFTATLLAGLFGTALTYIGVQQIMAGKITVGGFFTFTMLVGLLIAPVVQMVSIGGQITEAFAGLERTRELLQKKPENVDPRRQNRPGDLTGEIVFEQVNFSYDGFRPVLKDVCLHAKPGTVTALVGPSGAGKSTIIELIAGFHSPSAGTIFVDGVDLSTIDLESYRSHLGVVLQDSFLFDGSIRDNVAFSRPGSSEAEIVQACHLAGVTEFVDKLEKGYATLIGERGVKLSGGQRQRISIARALLANPKILILDEATSNLDSESETYIQQGLSYLMQGRTTFVIAHRLSTIRKADEILVVQEGRIIERGTHETLLAKKGRYSELCAKQQGMEQNFLLPGVAPESQSRSSEDYALPQSDAELIEDTVFIRSRAV